MIRSSHGLLVVSNNNGSPPIYSPPVIRNLHVDIWPVAPAVHTARPQRHLAGVVRVLSVVYLDGVVPAGQGVRAVHANAEVAAASLERNAKRGAVSAHRHGLDRVLGVDEDAAPYKISMRRCCGNRLCDDATFAVLDPLVVWENVG